MSAPVLQRINGTGTVEPNGFNCTGPYAYGGPMSPLLVHPSEIAAGEIKHAVAVTTHNWFFAPDKYIKITEPHGGGTHSPALARQINWSDGGSQDASTLFDAASMEQLPYGVRGRLIPGTWSIRAGTPAATANFLRILLTALERYGFVVMDGIETTSFGVALANDGVDPFNDWTSHGPNNQYALELYIEGSNGQSGMEWDMLELVSEGTDLGDMSVGSCDRVPVKEHPGTGI